MGRHQDDEQAPDSVVAQRAARRSHDLLESASAAGVSGGSESLITILVAFGANILIAVAKSLAGLLTGSASILAEAAHSWADTGNEIFLLIASRRSRRPPDTAHPFGHGREAYVWSMFAALGLLAAGAAVSVARGIQELINPEPASHFAIGYVVLAVSFVLEGISFLRSVRQARPEAESAQRDLIEHVLATSDPTLRAVFAEDSAALAGLVIAAAGLGAHQLTGSAIPDATGRPRLSTRTTNGPTCERADSHTMPAVATSATSEHSAAIVRQFLARVIRSPYRSSHSGRAAR